MSVFFKTADTFAVLQSDDRVPMSSDLSKMSQSAGDSVSAQFFRTMVMSHMLGCCGGWRCCYGDVTYAGVLWGMEVWLWLVMSHMLGCCGGWRWGYGDDTYARVLWGIEVWRGRSIFSLEDTLNPVLPKSCRPFARGDINHWSLRRLKCYPLQS